MNYPNVFVLETQSFAVANGSYFYGTIETEPGQEGHLEEFVVTRPVDGAFLDSLPDDERRTYVAGDQTTRFDTAEELDNAARTWMSTNAPSDLLYKLLDWRSDQSDPVWDGRAA